MKAIHLTTFILVLALHPVGPSTEAQSCLAPTLHVEITNITVEDDGSGVLSTVLHIADPNPSERVSGYNVYRSPSPSAPPNLWWLLAHDAQDQNAGTTAIEWGDASGDVSPSGAFYYLATAINGPCDQEGPRRMPSVEDTDADLVADVDDPCPATPAGMTLLTPGCSATDLLLQPERLVDPVDRGLGEFLFDISDVADIPIQILPSVDEARLGLQAVADDLRAAMPCSAAPDFQVVLGYLDDIVVAVEEHMQTILAGGGAGAGAETGGVGGAGGMDGSYTDPPTDWLLWEGLLFKFMSTHDAATESADVTNQICAAQGAAVELQGTVRRISDNERMIELDDGERIVSSWTLAVQGGDRLAPDAPVDVQGYSYEGGAVNIGTSAVTQVSPFPYIDTSQYDGCLQLRVLPVQPLPGAPYPQPSWERHPTTGYNQGGVLAFERGTKLMTEDTGCPGIVPGLGPSGEDVRIDYYIELGMNYQPRQGNWINGITLAHKVSGTSFPILLPDMDPGTDAQMWATEVKRTCVDGGINLPVISTENGNIVGFRRLWNCSSEQTVGTTFYDLRVRDPQAYCDLSYSTALFDIEDHDLTTWHTTSVTSANPAPGLVPGPVTFQAQGSKIVNNNPVSSWLGLNEDFAIHSPFAGAWPGYGTDRPGQLNWPHITGTRGGQPFRYTCSLSPLRTDLIQSCQGLVWTFFRAPFPSGLPFHVTQGNGGTVSHAGWQFRALDLVGNDGEPIRAARGGTVIMVRKDMLLNCIDQTCTEMGLPPGGRLDEYGNHVAIQHQDGTVGWYAHMRPNSSPLQVNDRVMRGDFLGLVGNTGNSTGPHLHFHVTPEDPNLWGNTTDEVRYEAYSVQNAQTETCMIPLQTLDYLSTNQP